MHLALIVDYHRLPPQGYTTNNKHVLPVKYLSSIKLHYGGQVNWPLETKLIEIKLIMNSVHRYMGVVHS